jgi:hypothetical protein
MSVDIRFQGAQKMSEEHNHQTPGSDLEPAVDARGGQLEQHCSQWALGSAARLPLYSRVAVGERSRARASPGRSAGRDRIT